MVRRRAGECHFEVLHRVGLAVLTGVGPQLIDMTTQVGVAR